MNAASARHPTSRAPPGGWRQAARWVAALPVVAGAAWGAERPVPAPALVPVPAEMAIVEGGGRLSIDEGYRVAFAGHADGRLAAAVARVAQRWEASTGHTFPREEMLNPADATLVIECAGPAPDWPEWGENEAYFLEVGPAQALLRAATPTGALRGLETWSQLLASDVEGWFVPRVTVRDAPRFAWRGLSLDLSRRWQPLEVIRRQLDGMTMVKLNVLQLQLSGDHGFRLQSHTHPRLHQMGADGKFYTQAELRDLVAYAAGRGIRVIPHFPLPARVTGWLVGHPEMGSRDGPYELIRTWRGPGAAFDPTDEMVYALLEDVLAEVVRIFPDAFVHIGGGRVTGDSWEANERIRAFIEEHGFGDGDGLQAYFLGRVAQILQRQGRRMLVQDDVWQPDLPAGVMVEVMGSDEVLETVARAGYSVLASRGFRLDRMLPAADLYASHPQPIGLALTEEEAVRIAGGVATLRSAWVSPRTIDSRIWPRAAAAAERWWSPRPPGDAAYLHHRLRALSRRLEEAGLRHESAGGPLLRQFAGDGATAAELRRLETVLEVIRPAGPEVQVRSKPELIAFAPLTGIADYARPDSVRAREFANDVRRRLLPQAIGSDPGLAIRASLVRWTQAARELERGLARRSPRVRELVPLLQAVQDACGAAGVALDALDAGRRLSTDEGQTQRAVLDRAGAPHGPVELAITSSMQRLVAGAASPEHDSSTPSDALPQQPREPAAVE